ncbi:BREX system Lon protease-like protein BrxL [Methylicorpusculum oleiharenae]|uniref:BREX system Lon protease-like protein BrxL n=1 Tax=Methylicorpusculum oleiharenae TaxID=1338687 RepID=UPI0013595A09|nr:BREX system Lon protease-like protein BrxL [Methylicorpusculum oleiharenae]MCD2452778.1 BREX system Lon protease-like protein BrxL [Methylicorpusculum oleiharenae]
MTPLDKKINTHFPGLVVRKDLVKTVKGNAIVPSYVLEYLLGQYCATSDEATIQTGIETVKEILRKHYVHRNEAGLVRSTIKEKGRYKVIDKVCVDLNDKANVYEATFENLGLKKVLIDSGTIKKHPKLLVGGVWCICDLEYDFTEDQNASPWILSSLKPIQLSHFDYESYIEARKQFTTEEWIDVLLQSIGLNPEVFGRRSKLIQLVRLIPFCERNYNLLELGPKGTGKSHIYSEFSPHATLVSGGEATLAKLFINNTTGKIGLVGYWDVVAMDEFAGSNKKPDIKLIDTLKNYMANKSFNRGTGPQGAEASMVYIGNTSHNVAFMLKHENLFMDLPETYRNSDGQAILDRMHWFLPGWEMENLRSEMFSDGYGFVVDYLAEVLRSLRNHDYADRYAEHFSLSSDISTRDRDGINKTFSGLMKILFPHGGASTDEIEELLKFAIEGRKRVKDQLMRIDQTYAKVNFAYLNSSQHLYQVTTLEEQEYPHYYHRSVGDGSDEEELIQSEIPTSPVEYPSISPRDIPEPVLKEKHLTFQENQKGISFDFLFGPYLAGANKITITDPYIRLFYQLRNFMEFLETIVRHKSDDAEVEVHLITTEDDFKGEQQRESLDKIAESCSAVGIHFTWAFDETGTIHARHILTDHGWKISLDRGLDIFQNYETKEAFTFTNRMQQYRACKAFEVTFIRCEETRPVRESHG